MPIEDFVKKSKKKYYLENKFLENVFIPLLGRGELTNLRAQVKIPRTDGSGRKASLDFVYKTNSNEYAIECDGYNWHAHKISSNRFEKLETKTNEIVRQDYILVRLTSDQIVKYPEKGMKELMRTLSSFNDMPVN